MVDIHTIIVFVLILPICYTVDIDYYVDEENNLQNGSSNIYARRREIVLEPSKYNDVQHGIIQAYYYKKRDESKQRTTRALSIKLNATAANNRSISNKTSKHRDKIKHLPVINVFKDYSYNYEDNAYEGPNETEQNYEPRILPEVSIGRNVAEYLPQFFNLEPAVDDTGLIKKIDNSSENVWYLPQNLPCWELPILYGELSRKKKNANVFAIFKDTLKNVIEPTSIKDKIVPRGTVKLSRTQSTNKWCEIEPCYGDHTLCLFENDDSPKTCGDNYEVKVPSVLEEIAIVNTVNAMRNHVANKKALRYKHLPTASNMNQIIYSHDLEDMARKWLLQCLPGSAPCSALDGDMVTELQCTKFAKHCCHNSPAASKCKARPECYVFSVIGCIHLWFWKAGRRLLERDVRCGKASVKTFPTVQLLWAATTKIGCAYAQGANGDVRVVCNFSPGAPFFISTKLFCGILSLEKGYRLTPNFNVTRDNFTNSLGLHWRPVDYNSYIKTSSTVNSTSFNRTVLDVNKTVSSKMDSLSKLYKEGWVRKVFNIGSNGTISWFAVLVSRHMFEDETESRCDSGQSIYKTGTTGQMCNERGKTFEGLCDEYGDQTTRHRLMALIASAALFILVLYDFFSGIVRQNN